MKADSFVQSSFGVLLKLHEVTQHRELIPVPTDTRSEGPVGAEQARFHYDSAGSLMFGGQ